MANTVLKAEDVDRLGLAILALGRELWVVKDRLKTLESYLEKQGTVPPKAIDQHQFTDRQAGESQAELDRLVDNLAAHLSGERTD